MPSFNVGRLKGRLVVYIYSDTGERIGRHRLRSTDKDSAEAEATAIFQELTKPKGINISELWNAYMIEYEGRVVTKGMRSIWKALEPFFGSIPTNQITIELCRSYARARRNKSITDTTIATDLGRLRMVLSWAVKRGYIDKAPYIERPTPSLRRDNYLTRQQCERLIKVAKEPHIKTFIVLALATGARDAALRELTWDRVDFERRIVDLRNPAITTPHKGRAIVPMNEKLYAALQEARRAALSDFVVEWAGNKVGSVKKGLKSVAARAGITGSVYPHIFRHSAAVHMAEAGITMDEIAQFLGHDDVRITRRVYARYSPDYLRNAAKVLQY